MRKCAHCGEPEGPGSPLALYAAHAEKTPMSRDPNDLEFVYNVWLHSSESAGCMLNYHDAKIDIIALSMVRRPK